MNSVPDVELENARNLASDGMYSEAAEAFRTILELRPEDPEVLRALAGVMQEVGETDASLALLADSVDLSEPNPKVLLKIADQLAEVGRLEESADFLLCAVCNSPDDQMLRLRTETLLRTLGRTEQLEWLQSGAEGEMPSA